MIESTSSASSGGVKENSPAANSGSNRQSSKVTVLATSMIFPPHCMGLSLGTNCTGTGSSPVAIQTSKSPFSDFTARRTHSRSPIFSVPTTDTSPRPSMKAAAGSAAKKARLTGSAPPLESIDDTTVWPVMSAMPAGASVVS